METNDQSSHNIKAALRPCVHCILTFPYGLFFVRIEPREKHVIQWLQVGSVSIAYDTDFSSSEIARSGHFTLP